MKSIRELDPASASLKYHEFPGLYSGNTTGIVYLMTNVACGIVVFIPADCHTGRTIGQVYNDPIDRMTRLSDYERIILTNHKG